ncbi:AraC family transcriptional regulator [Rhodococcus sp. D2-41]|uniref:Helix-turn-helix domain-containing protein n=1 Tax=Speluncibacter jeojiensis TaxID=2710754 RepID=A0A9X4M0P3_9ACTN|nr:helix-turn-helix domain-containing protein [Rhodococcus sp. D2-41]MDG3011284.1 AraC family transcriptional regulator [Rhodococcus sp. D2-41]MDG3015864.1 helix-turn-helix domain-containing protein [Corynebacteriales bacterium D3-21]
MRSWTDATGAAGARGIMRPAQVGTVYELGRVDVAAELAPYIEYYWTIRWALDSPRRETSSVLSHPAVHLSIEEGDQAARHGHPLPSVLVHGVITRRFDIELAGRGRVLGVKFRPGGFTALTGVAADRFTDRVESLTELRAGAADLRDGVLGLETDEARARLADERLSRWLPEVEDRDYALLREVVDDVAGDRTLIRAAAVARRHGLTDRSLQRLLRRYTGITASWLIRRYRLLDAMDALQRDPGCDIAELAVTLGWYDQPHFTRDFTAAVGVPPVRYVRGLGE